MMVALKKEFALKLYCLARQAERSIDFGLHSQLMWNEMREFFTSERIARFESAIRTLGVLLPDDCRPMTRDELPDRPAYLLPVYLVSAALNRFRKRWRFKKGEIAFVVRALKSFHNALQLPTKPGTQELVNLRMDLSACQWIIGGLLILPAFRKALNIEHFGQATHVKSAKWEEVVSDSAEDRSASKGLRKTA